MVISYEQNLCAHLSLEDVIIHYHHTRISSNLCTPLL